MQKQGNKIITYYLSPNWIHSGAISLIPRRLNPHIIVWLLNATEIDF
jgi:hypothetical protein